MELNSKIFSYYFPAFAESRLTTSLENALDFINSDKLKDKILRCREHYILKDLDSYDLLKKSLPAVTFSGVFNSQRKSSFLKSYTGLIVFDVDKLTLQEVEYYFDNIKDDDYVISIWRSPSGHGLKFIVYSEYESIFHKRVFAEVKQYFEKKYSIEIDKSGSDITRLCFLSYDEKMQINKSFSNFLLKNTEEIQLTTDSVLEKKSIDIKSVLTSGIIVPDKTFNVKKDKELINKIYHFLLKRNLSITESYDKWIKVAYVISDNFPYTVGKQMFLKLCELDKNAHDGDKSLSLINSSYRTIKQSPLSIGTIIFLAQEKGYETKYFAPKSIAKKQKKIKK